LKTFKPRPRADLKKAYPGIGEEGLDLINKMLVFNPYYRPTADECLEHPYLRGVRLIELEHSADKEVYLEIENEDELTMGRLRELFLREVDYFKTHSLFYLEKKESINKLLFPEEERA
jgi:serine/threonine protein kinase